MSTAPCRAPPRGYKSRAPGQPPPHHSSLLSPRTLLAKPRPVSVASLHARLEQSAPRAPLCPEQGRSSPSPYDHVHSLSQAAPHRPDPPLLRFALSRYQELRSRSTVVATVAESPSPSRCSPRLVAAPGEADQPPQTPRHSRRPPQALGEPLRSRPAPPSRCPRR
jgi:hypothetical protein